MTENTSTGRKTTFTVSGTLAVLAAWQLYRDRPTVAVLLFGIAAGLALMALLAPRLALGFHRGWMAVGGALGAVNSRILLLLIFYGLMVPLGLVLRLSGHDPLRRRRTGGESWWVPRANTRQTPAGFERPF